MFKNPVDNLKILCAKCRHKLFLLAEMLYGQRMRIIIIILKVKCDPADNPKTTAEQDETSKRATENLSAQGGCLP